MPEPITIGIVALFKWLAAYTAIHGATAAAVAHPAGTGLAAGAVGFHLTSAVILGTTVAA